MKERPIKIMISSSIYGFEDKIDQISAYLESLGYEVVSSHLGNIHVNPKVSNLNNCLQAVEDSDLFLGFIRTYCGTGKVGDQNITFEEFKYAIKLDKPYWFMAEHDVVFSRLLFSKGVKAKEMGKGVWDVLKPITKVYDPLCIEMYNEVVKNENHDIESRVGNWVQPFYNIGQIITYLKAQFSDLDYIKKLIASKQY